jgi:hypothetical protein
MNYALGWSYDRIQKKHPTIPKSTIGDTYRSEGKRVNNFSIRYSEVPRVITKDERVSLLEAIEATPDMSYKAVYVAPKLTPHKFENGR